MNPIADGVEAKRNRKENGNPGQGSDAGKYANKRADETAEESIYLYVGPERDRETQSEAVERGFHRILAMAGSEPEEPLWQWRFQRHTQEHVGEARHADAEDGRGNDGLALHRECQAEQEQRHGDKEAEPGVGRDTRRGDG